MNAFFDIFILPKCNRMKYRMRCIMYVMNTAVPTSFRRVRLKQYVKISCKNKSDSIPRKVVLRKDNGLVHDSSSGYKKQPDSRACVSALDIPTILVQRDDLRIFLLRPSCNGGGVCSMKLFKNALNSLRAA